MTDHRLDLSPLDPERDPAWRERLVQAVMTPVRNSSRPGMELRPGPSWNRADLLSDLVALTRPALGLAFAAAAVMILVSGSVVHGADQPRTSESPRVESYDIAEALGMPQALASWVEGGRTPSTGELLATLRGY